MKACASDQFLLLNSSGVHIKAKELEVQRKILFPLSAMTYDRLENIPKVTLIFDTDWN